jgi:hypothetical protein
MNLAISFGLLLGLLVLPVLVSGCLPDGRSGVPWYEARRDPTGLAPDPASTSKPESWKFPPTGVGSSMSHTT